MRKLAIVCLSLSAGILLSYYSVDSGILPVLSGICVLCFIILFFSVQDNKARPLLIALLAFSLGLSCFSLYRNRVERISGRIPAETFEHRAMVIAYPEQLTETSRTAVLILDPDAHYKAWLYDRYANTDGLRPGNVIRFSASFSPVHDRTSRAYESNLAKGFLATGSLKSEVLLEKKGPAFLFLSKELNRTVCETIPKVFSGNTSVFLKALLLGEKTDLYADDAIYSALLRSGFMHTVAVSGMHVSFVAGFCLLLFGSRRRGALLSIAIIWLFVFTTGNTPSALRAGIMQTVLLMAPVFRRENDPITSLSFALAILLLINPGSAGSISLQLSFGAALGIILFSGKIHELLLSGIHSQRIRRILQYPAAVLASSLGVSAVTIPLCGLHFGYFSILSILTNLAAIWLIPICFCGAFICVILFWIIPAPAILIGKGISILCRYVLLVCSAVAKIPYAVIPFDNPYILILFVLIYALFILYAFSAFSGARKILFPLGLSALLLVLYFGWFRIGTASICAQVAILDVGQGECVTAIAGNRSLVVDCGSSDYTVHAGERCAEFLFLHGQEDLDTLVLTHLHSDHVNGVCSLLRILPVKNLFIPINADPNSEEYRKILQASEESGTHIYLVDSDACLTSGEMTVLLYPSFVYTEENESCMSVFLQVNGRSFLITGDSPGSNEILLLEKPEIGKTDVLVAGHHGASGSTTPLFLQRIMPDHTVISVGRDNSYGHPSIYTLQRLQAADSIIYRTDRNGSVTFIIH